MRRYLPFVIIVGVLVVVSAGSLALWRSQRADTSAPFAGAPSPASATKPAAPSIANQPSAVVSPLPVVAMPTNIPPGVSVTVEEFGDYQCPPCGLLHPELKKIAAEYGKKVNFVFRNFPLTANHKNALPAAQAAEAARLQGHFEEMHDRIYEHQDNWKDLADPRPVFAKYAKEIGLDLNRFTRDVEGNEVRQKIDFDTQTATARGVNGTPTVFVENRQLKPEVTNLAGIRSGINIMLTHKAAGSKAGSSKGSLPD